MDRNFHTDDFERLLREKSDEFRMYPSKRIWHSIYNNIHPGHKWPSVAMSITLISALFLMGYLNTRNSNHYGTVLANKLQQEKIISALPPQHLTSITEDKNFDSPVLTNQKVENKTGFVLRENNSNNINNKTINKSTQNLETISHNKSNKTSSDIFVAVLGFKSDFENNKEKAIKEAEANEGIDLENSRHGFSTDIPADESQVNSALVNADQLFRFRKNNQPAQDNNTTGIFSINNDLSTTAVFNSPATLVKDISPDLKEQMISPDSRKNISAEDKNWIENFALYNRPAPKRWANKLNWEVYATPSVVYRTLFNNADFGSTSNVVPFAISTIGQNINASVNQSPSFGFELGTGLQYKLLKGVKIKSGFQLNFTRYNSHAFQNSHPVTTKLTMLNFESQSSYEVYRSTPYSNNSGLEAVNLHNETFQISIPVGVDFKLAGKDRLQWNIGASIQPTFVAGGKSYLISTDRHNYVKESSMLNRWNLNAGFETFISYKVNGLTWQLGPQFRKQLFSTNSKIFSIQEKTLTYGLKVGISKTIK